MDAMCKTMLVEAFEAELRPTREVLLALPADALEWRPHPDAFPTGRLAMHVASIPGWLPAFVNGDSYDMGAGGDGPATPASREEVMDRLERAIARGRASLAAVDEVALTTPWHLRRGGELVASMTRGEAIARYVVRHLVHHRGQLTVYFRMQGRAVPAIYGDSADRRLLPRRAGSA